MEWKLKAEDREKNEKLAPEYIPAVIYGKGVETRSLKLKRIEFDKVFAAAGESNLIDLETSAGTVKVLVKDSQHDVIKQTVSHVDFYQVNMKEKITTAIPLHFIGESKAVKELGGTLMKEMDELEVECLPSDLVDHIVVDIAALQNFDDPIRVGDLELPKTFRVLGHSEEDVVALVAEPKAQAEEAPAAPAADAKAGADAKTAAPAAGKTDKK